MKTKSLPGREIPEFHTWAEEEGQPPHDWNAFLAQETHTDEEWDAAWSLAYDWTTCACGNQCASIPRYRIGDVAPCGSVIWHNGEPKDRELSELGCRFWENIRGRRIAVARETLAAIELRSAALLAHGKGAQS